MVDQLFGAIVAQLPLVSVVGLALWIVYRDGRTDRQYMIELLTKLYMYKIEERGESASDHEETLMRRP